VTLPKTTSRPADANFRKKSGSRYPAATQVDTHCLYLGQLPRNFYYTRKRDSRLLITCHLWCLRPQHTHWQPTLNPDELRAFKWVPYARLLDPSHYRLVDALRLGLIERITAGSPLAQSISRNVQQARLPELELGMDRGLWGLTLFLWSYSLQMARRRLAEESRIDRETLEILNQEIEHTKMLQVKFRRGYLLRYPVQAVLQGWHQLNRVRPFTY
jgi:hypothetical protein